MSCVRDARPILCVERGQGGRQRGRSTEGTQMTFFLEGDIFSPSGFQSGLGFKITNPSSTDVKAKY